MPYRYWQTCLQLAARILGPLLLMCPPALGQSPELFKSGYSYLPEARLDNGADSLSSSFSEFGTSFLVPFQPSEKWVVLLGAAYSMVVPHSPSNLPNTRLYFVGIQCTTAYKLNEQSQLVTMLLPAFSSTFQDPLSTKDVLFQAGLAYFRNPSNNFRYGIGGVYTSRFGYPLFLPLLSLEYETARVLYELTFPTELCATWNHNARLSYGLKVTVNGSQYNPAEDAEYAGVPIDAVSYSRALLGPEIHYHLGRRFYLIFFGGLAFRRVLELKSEIGPGQDLGQLNGGFFATRISLRPPRRPKKPES